MKLRNTVIPIAFGAATAAGLSLLKAAELGNTEATKVLVEFGRENND